MKTLVFSFDGTGNEPVDTGKFKKDESISNIMKLQILMGGGFRADKTETKTPSGQDQVTYYYNGIGTRDNGIMAPLIGWVCKKVNMALAPTWGDAEEILQEAKEDFDTANYQEGDKVVVFGFSRGAALARKFASMILANNKCCEVSFLGVFDTVAAMNGIHRKGEDISSDVVFENGTLNKKIQRAVHIVSLDEDRVSFEPTLINKDVENPNRILEVWFPGVHSDIGGGYWYDGLSDLALEFMIKESKNTLGYDISIDPGKDATAIEKLIKAQGTEFTDFEVDDIVINPMVKGIRHEHSGILAKMGGREPRSVCVNDNDRPSKNAKDIPLLHPSVQKRFQKVPSYRPAALRGLKFCLLQDDGKKISKHGINGLRK